MAARMIRMSGAQEHFALNNGLVRIGRSKQNEITIDSVFVSRFHAVIHRAGTDYVLVDLGKTNSTFVNNESIQNSSRILAHQDTVRFGDVSFLFEHNKGEPYATQHLAPDGAQPEVPHAATAQEPAPSGAAPAAPPVPATADKAVCPRCQTSYPAVYAFCPQDGTELINGGQGIAVTADPATTSPGEDEDPLAATLPPESTDMVICPRCQRPCRREALFCPRDGQFLADARTQQK